MLNADGSAYGGVWKFLWRERSYWRVDIRET